MTHRALRSPALVRWLLLATLPYALSALAGQDSDNNTAGGLNVSQDLRHRVVVPQILYFRIGPALAGDVAEVNIEVNPAGATGNEQSYAGTRPPPIGDGTVIAATSNGTLDVQVLGNVGTVTLTYDLSDLQGLADGAGNFIPFDEIDVTSEDPGGLPAPALSNAGGSGAVSVPISGNLFSGRVIRRQSRWTFRYANSAPVRSGTYTGSVRYTITAP